MLKAPKIFTPKQIHGHYTSKPIIWKNYINNLMKKCSDQAQYKYNYEGWLPADSIKLSSEEIYHMHIQDQNFFKLVL